MSNRKVDLQKLKESNMDFKQKQLIEAKPDLSQANYVVGMQPVLN